MNHNPKIKYAWEIIGPAFKNYDFSSYAVQRRALKQFLKYYELSDTHLTDPIKIFENNCHFSELRKNKLLWGNGKQKPLNMKKIRRILDSNKHPYQKIMYIYYHKEISKENKIRFVIETNLVDAHDKIYLLFGLWKWATKYKNKKYKKLVESKSLSEGRPMPYYSYKPRKKFVKFFNIDKKIKRKRDFPWILFFNSFKITRRPHFPWVRFKFDRKYGEKINCELSKYSFGWLDWGFYCIFTFVVKASFLILKIAFVILYFSLKPFYETYVELWWRCAYVKYRIGLVLIDKMKILRFYCTKNVLRLGLFLHWFFLKIWGPYVFVNWRLIKKKLPPLINKYVLSPCIIFVGKYSKIIPSLAFFSCLLAAWSLFFLFWLVYFGLIVGYYLNFDFVIKNEPQISDFYRLWFETYPQQIYDFVYYYLYPIKLFYVEKIKEVYEYLINYHLIHKPWMKIRYIYRHYTNSRFKEYWYINVQSGLPEATKYAYHERGSMIYDNFFKYQEYRNIKRAKFKYHSRNYKYRLGWLTIWNTSTQHSYKIDYLFNKKTSPYSSKCKFSCPGNSEQGTYGEFFYDKQKPKSFNVWYPYRRMPYYRPGAWHKYKKISIVQQGLRAEAYGWSIFDQTRARRELRWAQQLDNRRYPAVYTPRFYQELIYFKLRALAQRARKGPTRVVHYGFLNLRTKKVTIHPNYYYPNIKNRFLLHSQRLRASCNLDSLHLSKKIYYQRFYVHRFGLGGNRVFGKRAKSRCIKALFRKIKFLEYHKQQYLNYIQRNKDKDEKCYEKANDILKQVLVWYKKRYSLRRAFKASLFYEMLLKSNYFHFNRGNTIDPLYLFSKHQHLCHKSPDNPLTNQKLFFRAHEHYNFNLPRKIFYKMTDARLARLQNVFFRKRVKNRKFDHKRKPFNYKDIKLNGRLSYVRSPKSVKAVYKYNDGKFVDSLHFNRQKPGYLKKIEQDHKKKNYLFRPYEDPFLLDWVPPIEEPPLKKRRSNKKVYRKRLIRRRSIFWHYFF